MGNRYVFTAEEAGVSPEKRALAERDAFADIAEDNEEAAREMIPLLSDLSDVLEESTPKRSEDAPAVEVPPRKSRRSIPHHPRYKQAARRGVKIRHQALSTKTMMGRGR